VAFYPTSSYITLLCTPGYKFHVHIFLLSSFLLFSRTFCTHVVHTLTFFNAHILVLCMLAYALTYHMCTCQFPFLVYVFTTHSTYLLVPMEFITLLLCLISPVYFLYCPIVSMFYGNYCSRSNSYQGKKTHLQRLSSSSYR
jgi:hypothetical protein